MQNLIDTKQAALAVHDVAEEFLGLDLRDDREEIRHLRDALAAALVQGYLMGLGDARNPRGVSLSAGEAERLYARGGRGPVGPSHREAGSRR